MCDCQSAPTFFQEEGQTLLRVYLLFARFHLLIPNYEQVRATTDDYTPIGAIANQYVQLLYHLAVHAAPRRRQAQTPPLRFLFTLRAQKCRKPVSLSLVVTEIVNIDVIPLCLRPLPTTYVYSSPAMIGLRRAMNHRCRVMVSTDRRSLYSISY